MRAYALALPLLLIPFAGFVGECKAVPAGEEKPAPTAREEAEEKAQEEQEDKAPVLIGPVTREQVEEAVPDWVAAEIEAAPLPEGVQALAAAPPGAEVTVFLGTWCGDSRRELSRLWKAIDEAAAAGGAVPFAISYVGVDEDKKEPAAQIASAGVQYVPTFIVERDGREMGRIVESAPHGIERDLAALLDGSARGMISDRDDLGGGAPPP